jgi:hypothetical protein
VTGFMYHSPALPWAQASTSSPYEHVASTRSVFSFLFRKFLLIPDRALIQNQGKSCNCHCDCRPICRVGPHTARLVIVDGGPSYYLVEDTSLVSARLVGVSNVQDGKKEGR